jgi:hypothetical protein
MVNEIAPDTKVILVTGARQESVAVAAMKAGAADYISKDEFLTSGIVRALQAALRQTFAVAEAEQRDALTSRSRELQEASVEGAWLLQALDERHGYRAPAGQSREPLSEEWTEAVEMFTTYLRAAGSDFPQPATEQEDALLRIIMERGASPRDVFRLYVAAVRQLMLDPQTGEGPVPIRPVIFLTHALACMLEEVQTVLSLSEMERGVPIR